MKRYREDTPSPSSGNNEVIELPSWIRTSEFVEQFEIDFPGHPIKLPPDRNFPFPTEVNEGNIQSLLDNVRFFGMRDSSYMVRHIFDFLIQQSLDDQFVETLKSNFEELKVIWRNVLFARKHLLDNTFSVRAASENLLMCLKYAHEN
jgi:hypothetical protein